MGKLAKVVCQACHTDVLVGPMYQVGIFKRLASVRVDHGVDMVCEAVLSRDEVPSGLCITGSGARRKTGWIGHGAGVC